MSTCTGCQLDALHGSNRNIRHLLTTTRLRVLWGPPCPASDLVTIPIYGAGHITIRKSTVAAWEALSGVLRWADYKTRAGDTGAYNCRRITGGRGWSLHAYGIAADLNWNSNPYGPVLRTDMPASMVHAIQAICTHSGAQVFRWGGTYTGNKDAMHFEIVCSPTDLATGIDDATVKGRTPAQTLPWPGLLRRGDTGPAIVQLGFLLRLCGYKGFNLSERSTHVFDALRRFQRNNGLRVTGQLDRVTWAKLEAKARAKQARKKATKR